MDADEQKAVIRKLAQARLLQFSDAQGRVQDLVADTARWIMAGLITINGGASLAVMSLLQVTVYGKTTAAGCFCAGIFLALVSGYTTILGGLSVLPTLVGMGLEWEGYEIIGEINHEQARNYVTRLKSKLIPWTVASHTLGIFSVAAFVFGVIQVGLNLK